MRSLKYMYKTSKISRYLIKISTNIRLYLEETVKWIFFLCFYLIIVSQSDGHRIYKDLKAYLNAVRGLLDSMHGLLLRSDV